MSTDDLMVWLRGVLDGEEVLARHAAELNSLNWTCYTKCVVDLGVEDGCIADTVITNDRDVAEHIARHDPARVLRQVRAHREILDWCVETIGDRDLNRYGEPGALADDRQALAVTPAVETSRLLASIYSDMPGYRQEWRPA